MAVALVGSLGTVSTGTTTVTPSFAQATTAGNLLICWAMGSCTSALTMRTTASGWTSPTPGGNINQMCVVMYKPNCAAGETAPTVNFSAGTGLFVAAALAEFSGCTTAPADQTGKTNNFASPLTATAAGAEAQIGELLCGASSWFFSKAGTDVTAITFNNVTTISGDLSNDATSTVNRYHFSWGIGTSNGSATTETGTCSDMNITDGGLHFVSFKIPTVVAVVPRGRRRDYPQLLAQ